MTTLHIVIISVCGALLVGMCIGLWIGTIALQSERDESERLREKILGLLREKYPLLQFNSADSFPAQENVGAVAGNLSADVSPSASAKVSAAVEVESGASAQSGPIGARTDNWREMSCDKTGHLFNWGDGYCLRCGAKQACPASIEIIRSIDRAAS